MRFGSIIVAATLLAATSAAQGTIVGSAHDFSAAGWNTGGEICRVCHIPHVEGRPAARTTSDWLWGRELSGATYTPYTSPSMTATMGQPTGTSVLCLSCHDGTVALENFHTATGGTNYVTKVVPGLASGTDFSADHPVSITYDDTNDPGLNAKTTNVGGTIAGQTIADILEGGTDLQCNSCHDPHNVEVPAGVGNFLRVDNAASGLCLVCHDK